jgi:hypothetical protein
MVLIYQEEAMRFLKTSNQHAVDVTKISELTVTGRETEAYLNAIMDNGKMVRLSYHKSFLRAQLELDRVIDVIEEAHKESKTSSDQPV